MTTQTNAERLERLKDINDTKYITALDNPTDDGCHPKSINVEHEIDWLIEQAERAQKLKNENLWLYGRLNMISDIIEKGRKEMPR